MSPKTLHVKVKVPLEQVGGAAVNCPVAAPARREIDIYSPLSLVTISEVLCVFMELGYIGM